MKLVARGFTLVELVVVLVLVGIAGVMIASRYLNPSAFDTAATRDTLVATIRAAQQASVGRANVSFHLDKTGDDVELTVLAGVDEIRRIDVRARNVTLGTGTALTSDSCAASGSFDDDLVDFELNYDGSGNLVSFSNDGATELVSNSLFNGVRICIDEAADTSVCVSRAGYAYIGDCDE